MYRLHKIQYVFHPNVPEGYVILKSWIFQTNLRTSKSKILLGFFIDEKCVDMILNTVREKWKSKIIHILLGYLSL
jgi:predicted KAP-like P-loop ATPase